MWLLSRLKILSLVPLLAVVALARQDPVPAPVPVRDYNFNCIPMDSVTTPSFTLHFVQFPFDQISVIKKAVLASADSTPPVIRDVIISGSLSVLGNTKFITLDNGMPFTITATDDSGVVAASLFVDGKLKTTETDDPKLRDSFYMRWDAYQIAPGPHNFKLVVWDGAGNQSEQTWVMTR